MRKKKKSLFSKLTSKGIILTVQLVTTIIFLRYIYVLKMLPVKYYFSLVVILLLLLFIEMVWITSGARKKRRTGSYKRIFVSKLVSVLLSVLFITGSVYASIGDNFISNITSAFMQTRVIAVYAMKNGDIEKLDDLKGKTFGVENKTSVSDITNALAKIQDKIDRAPEKKNYDDYVQLADALYKGEVDCIIADQSYLGILETNHEGFTDETRLIYKMEIQEELKAVTTKTDVTENPFIVYLTGIDTYGSVSTISRADVNLVVCVNPLEKQVLMVSVPRDTQINLHKNGKMDKITHSAMYGINETIQTLEDLLKLKVNYYAKTNFSGMINIIDALGGVEVESPYEFTTLHGNYKIKKGMNEMSGDKALCFVRERYALPHGDFDRGKNQQRLLKAMLKKAMSPKIITNYNSILSAVEGSFETDMTSDDIKSLINMQLNDMANWEIFNVQITGADDISYDTYSQKGKKTYITIPDKEVLSKIIKVIDKVESGKKLTDNDVKELN
ncbi:LCP family protein [Thomasclavelia cocleata]|uniref:LCP family protein n=1 Tax=Thomasclavelia cocleata TaxID=69824 RepID=UPI0024315C2D|nr:LCP family protein [Thomasclavelia cocleata]